MKNVCHKSLLNYISYL